MDLKWETKHFNDLSNIELYKILQLRAEVFIMEQNCHYVDIDNKDINAYQVLAWDGDILVAGVRLLAPNVSYPEMSIGRVLTKPSHRKQKIGIQLMKYSIEEAYNLYGYGDIKIGAQLYLKKYYESFGFKQVSSIYLEDEIEHIKMLKSVI